MQSVSQVKSSPDDNDHTNDNNVLGDCGEPRFIDGL